MYLWYTVIKCITKINWALNFKMTMWPYILIQVEDTHNKLSGYHNNVDTLLLTLTLILWSHSCWILLEHGYVDPKKAKVLRYYQIEQLDRCVCWTYVVLTRANMLALWTLSTTYEVFYLVNIKILNLVSNK